MIQTASQDATLSWPQAYFEFLKSPRESILLKIAPLVMMGLLPVDLVSNLLPVIGIADDVGLSGLGIVVIIKTISRVHQYRHPPR